MIARVHIGPLVAIDLDRNEKLIDERREGGIFVAFAVDDVAPMAPDRPDVQQDGLILGASPRKSFLAPFIPFDRLMGGRAQIRAGGTRETIGLLGAQSFSPLQRAHCTRVLLHRIIAAGVARIEGLAPGETFVLPMPETDALFAEPPAKVDLFVIDNGGKIEQAGIEILDQAAG